MGRPRIYTLNENYFENIDAQNKAYIIGFLYADGSISENSITINISEQDIEILDFIKKELNYNGPYHYSIVKNHCYCKLTITCKKLISDLIKIGVIKNKTYDSKILPVVDFELIPHLLRGLFDGDGSIYSNKTDNKTIEYTVNFSSNKFILTEIKLLLKNYNISSSNIRYRRDSIYSGMLDIRGSMNIEKFYNLIYSDSNFYLQRKYIRFNDFNNVISKITKRHIVDSIISDIKQLYVNGFKQSEISKITNVNFSSVRCIIQRLRKQNEIT